jgi:multidrug efflux pump subunit AcrB
MVCARFIDKPLTGRLARIDGDGAVPTRARAYARGMNWALNHRWLMLGVTVGTVF